MFTRIALFALATCAFVACDDDLVSIDRDFSGATLTYAVPSTDSAGAINITREDIDVDLRQQLDDFGISEDQLRAVMVQSVVATLNDPSGEFTFDDLSNASITITGGSLPAVQIANLPQGSGTTATFDVPEVEIKEYLLLDMFDASLSGTSSEAIGEEVTVDVDVTYQLTGGI